MALTTGNDYDHIDLSNGTDTIRHYLKDIAARDDLIKVQSAQPSETENKIWITSGATEVEIPTYDEFSNLKSHSTLQAENIPDTVQTITFDSEGNVQTITHTRDNVAVRTDAFTFAESTITEVRTLSTGESLTIVTNITTLQTTVTYAAA